MLFLDRIMFVLFRIIGFFVLESSVVVVVIEFLLLEDILNLIGLGMLMLIIWVYMLCGMFSWVGVEKCFVCVIMCVRILVMCVGLWIFF